MSASDDRRLQEEIARYRDCLDVHELPAIYHTWSNRYVLPKLQACGFEGVDEFFAHYLLDACRARPGHRHRFASIGSGNCDLEVRLAQRLLAAGAENFVFECLELNPHMLERGRALAVREGVADHLSFHEVDFESWQPDGPLSGCLANHSLHHVVGLEALFAKIRSALADDGVFLTNDMIGRNGHMRWPEALVHVERFWSRLPRRQKYDNQRRVFDDTFANWDCSVEGNEGIRAQDILPLLIEEFHFEAFIAFANVIDVFVDRSYGHNFDPDDPADVTLIEEIARLDEARLDAGEIKPTHLIAAMRTRPGAEIRCYRHWTPEFCVRIPDQPYRRRAED
jgi:SAM-dependent methyltransferase